MFPHIRQSLVFVLIVALFSGHIYAAASTLPEDEIVLAEGTAKELKKLKFIGKDKIKAPELVVELTPSN